MATLKPVCVGDMVTYYEHLCRVVAMQELALGTKKHQVAIFKNPDWKPANSQEKGTSPVKFLAWVLNSDGTMPIGKQKRLPVVSTPKLYDQPSYEVFLDVDEDFKSAVRAAHTETEKINDAKYKHQQVANRLQRLWIFTSIELRQYWSNDYILEVEADMRKFMWNLADPNDVFKKLQKALLDWANQLISELEVDSPDLVSKAKEQLNPTKGYPNHLAAIKILLNIESEEITSAE